MRGPIAAREGHVLKIWGRNNSSNVQKVLWCCAELDLTFERIDVGGAFGGTRDVAYLAKNPNALVPTIEDDGFVLWESNAIVRYLAAKHGAGTLWPADAQARADAERWMDWQISTISPAIHPVFWGLVRTAPADRDAGMIEAGRQKTAAARAILDAHLAGHQFVMGNSFTMADIPLGIQTHRWTVMDVERPPAANLEAWYGRLIERPGFRSHVMIPLT